MELLAVIVILAVIMVITIPTVLGSMSKSKEKAFETVGQTMKKYLVDNYKNCKLGNKDVARYDEELFNSDCSLKGNISNTLITNSGYSEKDIKEVKVGFNGDDFELTISPNEKGD